MASQKHPVWRGSKQATGAYGELIAEAELIRHGWAPSNLNRTIRNALSFDILAYKGTYQVKIRVKACSPGMDEFTWGGFTPYQPVPIDDIDAKDFTLLVSIGAKRANDAIYVVPTRELRIALRAWQKEYLARPKQDGGKRKDTGQWNIRLGESRKNPESAGYGFAKKWQKYLDNWGVLENP